MAKQRRGENTAAVSEYLAAHPEAGPKEIVAALAKQRIKITTAHVSNIKGKLIKGGTAKKAAKKYAAPVAMDASRCVELPRMPTARLPWSWLRRSPMPSESSAAFSR